MTAKILRTRLVLFALLFLLHSATAQEETVSDFSEITGTVVDSRNRPIESFEVKVRIYDYSEGGWRIVPKVSKQWKGKFTNGEYQFDVNETFDANNMTYVSRIISAPGYLELNQNNSFVSLGTFDGKFKKATLSRGVRIKGKLALPDNIIGETVKEPKLFVSKKSSGLMSNFNRFERGVEVNSDGTFQAMVPENCKLNLIAFGSNAASTKQQITIPKFKSEDDEQDLGSIKLTKGVSLSGTVVKRDGSPVAGQIVQIQQLDQGRFIQSGIFGCAVSDADGKFKLPPREGKCRVSLLDAAKIDGKIVKVKGEKLAVKAIEVNLKVGEAASRLEIREGDKWTIQGTVKNHEALSSQTYVLITTAGEPQEQLELDSDGNFETEVLDGCECRLTIYGFEDNEFYLAKLSDDSIRKYRQHFKVSPMSEAQLFQLREVTSDIGPLEFTMRKRVPDERSMTERMLDWWIYGD